MEAVCIRRSLSKMVYIITFCFSRSFPFAGSSRVVWAEALLPATDETSGGRIEHQVYTDEGHSLGD